MLINKPQCKMFWYLAADKDFMIPESGYVEVVFPAGQTEAPFTVPIKDDDIFEKSESFRVMIMPVSVPYGVELGNPRSSIAVIIDNDGKLIAVSL